MSNHPNRNLPYSLLRGGRVIGRLSSEDEAKASAQCISALGVDAVILVLHNGKVIITYYGGQEQKGAVNGAHRS